MTPNLKDILLALLGLIGALGGAWLGARLTRQSARDLLATQAKQEFACAFTDTLFRLSTEVAEEREGRAWHILKEEYPTHLRAYLRLLSVLPLTERAKVEQAWQTYTGERRADPNDEPDFYRFSEVLSPETDEQQHMLARKRVRALLLAAGT